MIAVQSNGSTQAGSSRGAHHAASCKFPHRGKKVLRSAGVPVYGYIAPAKSGAGIGVLVKSKATHDAPSVFFCAASSVHPFFSGTALFRACIKIMVGWAGASSEAPVPFDAGYANPVQSITSEIGVSGDGFNTQSKEAAIMATTPTQNPKLTWIITAVRHAVSTVSAKFVTFPRRQRVKHVAYLCRSTSASSLATCQYRRCAVDRTTCEIITQAQQALTYSSQAIAVLNIWMDALTTEDEQESQRVAAVDTLLREAVSWLEKISEVAA